MRRSIFVTQRKLHRCLLHRKAHSMGSCFWLRKPEVIKQYNAVVSTIANENGISLKGSGKNQAGSNTLSGIMKKMVDTDYEPIKVNFIDAKTSESFKEIAAINAKAIFNELNFQPDEYASMVAEQSTIISDQQSEIDRLKEENRKLKIEIGGS